MPGLLACRSGAAEVHEALLVSMKASVLRSARSPHSSHSALHRVRAALLPACRWHGPCGPSLSHLCTYAVVAAVGNGNTLPGSYSEHLARSKFCLVAPGAARHLTLWFHGV